MHSTSTQSQDVQLDSVASEIDEEVGENGQDGNEDDTGSLVRVCDIPWPFGAD